MSVCVLVRGGSWRFLLSRSDSRLSRRENLISHVISSLSRRHTITKQPNSTKTKKNAKKPEAHVHTPIIETNREAAPTPCCGFHLFHILFLFLSPFFFEDGSNYSLHSSIVVGREQRYGLASMFSGASLFTNDSSSWDVSRQRCHHELHVLASYQASSFTSDVSL